jgi:MoxR-like ATPase
VLKRLLIVSAAFVFSADAFASTTTSTGTQSLFGLDLELHPKVFNQGFETYVGFPQHEAEALLYVLTRGVPRLQSIILEQAKIIDLKDQQLSAQAKTIDLQAESINDATEIAEAWRAASRSPSLLWVIGSFAAGAVAVVVLDRILD